MVIQHPIYIIILNNLLCYFYFILIFAYNGDFTSVLFPSYWPVGQYEGNIGEVITGSNVLEFARIKHFIFQFRISVFPTLVVN